MGRYKLKFDLVMREPYVLVVEAENVEEASFRLTLRDGTAYKGEIVEHMSDDQCSEYDVRWEDDKPTFRQDDLLERFLERAFGFAVHVKVVVEPVDLDGLWNEYPEFLEEDES